MICRTFKPPSRSRRVVQTTQYIRGTTTNTSGIASNDLLSEIRFPDKTTGNPSTNAANIEAFTYNDLGEVSTKMDRNGNVHEYTRDALGRLTRDYVGSFGTGVDQSVAQMTWSFDDAGRLYTLDSRNAGGGVLNQVLRQYNGYGQLEMQRGHDSIPAAFTP